MKNDAPTKRAPIGLILGLTGAGGCLGLIALVVVLAVFFFRGAMEKCPPKDFPIYPGAHQTDFNYVTSGATSSCLVGWESDAASTQVSTFYEDSRTGDTWQLVAERPPTVPTNVAATGVGTTGGSLEPGTYYLEYTFVNAGGESLGSRESALDPPAKGPHTCRCRETRTYASRPTASQR